MVGIRHNLISHHYNTVLMHIAKELRASPKEIPKRMPHLSMDTPGCVHEHPAGIRPPNVITHFAPILNT